MGTRKNLLKSINTVKAASNTDWMPTYVDSKEATEHFDKKIENLQTETTSTSTHQLISDIEYPIPYTFRVQLPVNGARTSKAKCPPFHMQLDHTIAVLWHVFANENEEQKKTIGIGQLQWALYFLKGIKDPLEGTRQADIDVAIKVLEDTLIECYAAMAHIVMSKPEFEDNRSVDTNVITLSIPKPSSNIDSSASLGMMVKPRRNFNKVQDFSQIFSSASFMSFENSNPEVSSITEELVKFRCAMEDPKFCLVPSNALNDTNTDVSKNKIEVDDIYVILKQLREEQVKKLNSEIETLRQLNEATNVKQKEWLKIYPAKMNNNEPFCDY